MRKGQSVWIVVGLLTLSAVAVALWLLLQRGSSSPPPTPPSIPAARDIDDASGPPRLPLIDVHVHVSQEGLERLVSLMDPHDISHAVNLSGGHPLRGLNQQVAAAKKTGRVTVFASLPYEQAGLPDYGERMAAAVRIAHDKGARGLKIAKTLGLSVKGPDGALLPIDDPGLDPVFEVAGELDMPVAIHAGDPKAFWQPVDADNERRAELAANPGWALHGKDVPSFDAIHEQLENRIARHPRTTFISVHFGNAAEEPERVADILENYPNVYIDTAARIPEIGRHSAERMRAFFIRFQDRILFGSDLGVGRPGTPLFLGSRGPEPPGDREEQLFFSATRRYFETADEDFAHPTPIQGDWTIDGIHLPRPVLKKIYYQNAARVIGVPLPE